MKTEASAPSGVVFALGAAGAAPAPAPAALR
jgi:hypothetical protein